MGMAQKMNSVLMKIALQIPRQIARGFRVLRCPT